MVAWVSSIPGKRSLKCAVGSRAAHRDLISRYASGTTGGTSKERSRVKRVGMPDLAYQVSNACTVNGHSVQRRIIQRVYSISSVDPQPLRNSQFPKPLGRARDL